MRTAADRESVAPGSRSVAQRAHAHHNSLATGSGAPFEEEPKSAPFQLRARELAQLQAIANAPRPGGWPNRRPPPDWPGPRRSQLVTHPRAIQLQRYRNLANGVAPARLVVPSVARAAPTRAGTVVQCVINLGAVQSAGAAHGSRLGGTVEALAGPVEAFNAHEHDDFSAADTLHAQMGRLHAIEEIVNPWIRDNSATMNAADRTAMFALLHQIEAHHTTLVQHTLAHGHALWMRPGTGHHENQAAQQLWTSLRTNAGNVKIDTSNAGAHTQIMAGMAKLLQGAHGRQLLTTLNAPQATADRQIHVGTNWSGVFAAAPARPQHNPGSWAFPTGSLEDERDAKHKDGHTGTGSYVQIDYGAPEEAAGASDEAIPMPHFITLGHELGHAAHNLAGQKRMDWDMHDAPPEADERGLRPDRALWSNPEEFQNITRQENPLRDEHQLPRRAFHRPPDVVAKTRRYHALKQRFNALSDTVPGGRIGDTVRRSVPEFDEAEKMLYLEAEAHDFTNVATLDTLERNVAAAERGIPPALIAAHTPPAPAPASGMSLGTKVAIGAGLIAFLGGAAFLGSKLLKK